MKKTGCLYLVCLFVLSSLSFADEEKQIVKVSTTGNFTLKSNEILSKVQSRPGTMFDSAKASKDAERIAKMKGVEFCYFNVKDVDGGTHLTFVVVERSIVRTIEFHGNDKIKDRRLAKKVEFKKGTYLDPVLAEAAAAKIQQYYIDKGYAFANVTLDESKLSKGNVIFKIEEGNRVRVKSVKFVGNEQIKTRNLKTALKNAKTRKFLLFKNYYKEKGVDKDLDRLQNAYDEMGFLDAKIELERELNDEQNEMHLTFKIDEGERSYLSEIVFQGNEFYDNQTLLEGMELEKGSVFSRKKAERDAKNVAGLYGKEGFVDVLVESDPVLLSPSEVKLVIDVNESDRFRIGEIHISGNKLVKEKVIRHVLDEYDFKPGNWYNADLARGDGEGYLEKLIQQTAYTDYQTPRSSTITPADAEKKGVKDAKVQITEGQTGSIMLGAGIASDSGAIGQLVFDQRNFDITDTPESFRELITGKAFRGAGQRFRIALAPGTEVSTYSVSFTEPYMFDRPLAFDVAASSYERYFESYDEGRLKGMFALEKRYKNRWRRNIAFRVEQVDVADLDYDAPKEIRDVRGNNNLFGVRFGARKDTTDDLRMPNTGYSFDVSYEQLGGDHTFGILSSVYRRYFTLHTDFTDRKTVLATKLLGATVIGNAPPFEKFYAGGTGTYGIRGFEYRGVSTRGLQTGITDPNIIPQRDDPVGSDWVLIANTELTVPMVGETLAGLFFIDTGLIDTGSYRASAGIGVQILIPQWFGPVPMRIELAAPLMKNEEDETKTFSFSVGRLF